MTMPAIRVRAVTKKYGALTALGGVDLEIDQGEFFGLLGPNGWPRADRRRAQRVDASEKDCPRS